MGDRSRRGFAARSGLRQTVLALAAISLVAAGVTGCGGPSSARVVVPRFTLVREGHAATSIAVPSRFGERLGIAVGEPYSLRARVVLPAALRTGPVRLVFPSFLAVPRVEVDGRPVVRQGLGLPAVFAVREPHVYVVPADVVRDGIVDLRIDVTHRWPFDTSIAAAPRIVPADVTDPLAATTILVNVLVVLFALGAGLVTVVVSAIVASSSRAHRHYGFITLAVLGVTPYLAFSLGFGQAVFGPSEVYVAALGLAVAVIATGRFVASYVAIPSPTRRWLALVAIIPLARLVLGDRHEVAYVSSAVVGLLFAIGFGRQLVMHVRLARRGVVGARLWVACFSVISVTTATDVLYFAGGPDLARGVRIGMIGVLYFFCFFAYLMADGEALSLLRARKELDGTVVDLVRARDAAVEITSSLQDVVVARSTRYYTALASLVNHRATPTFGPGDAIGERHVVVRAIDGESGVYEAIRTSDEQRVEIVVLGDAPGPVLGSAARTLSRLGSIDHEGIARPIEVDVASTGFVYVVFPRRDGVALDHRSLDALDFRDRSLVVARAAEALAALHDAGLVHTRLANESIRVDPANALRTSLGRIDLAARNLAVDRSVDFPRTKRPSDRSGLGPVSTDAEPTEVPGPNARRPMLATDTERPDASTTENERTRRGAAPSRPAIPATATPALGTPAVATREADVAKLASIGLVFVDLARRGDVVDAKRRERVRDVLVRASRGADPGAMTARELADALEGALRESPSVDALALPAAGAP